MIIKVKSKDGEVVRYINSDHINTMFCAIEDGKKHCEVNGRFIDTYEYEQIVEVLETYAIMREAPDCIKEGTQVVHQEQESDSQEEPEEPKEFVYPDVLHRTDEMFKEAVLLNADSAIFDSRKGLMEAHFNEHPIYVDESYYTRDNTFGRVVRFGDDFKEGCYNRLSEWRDCHYYKLYDYKGHLFFVMTGGRYD